MVQWVIGWQVNYNKFLESWKSPQYLLNNKYLVFILAINTFLPLQNLSQHHYQKVYGCLTHNITSHQKIHFTAEEVHRSDHEIHYCIMYQDIQK